MSLSPRRRHVGQTLRLCAALALVVNLLPGLPLGLSLSGARAARRSDKSLRAGVATPPQAANTATAPPAPLLATTPLNQRVLVVYNANEPESLEVADY
jgi:hypothetical protein